MEKNTPGRMAITGVISILLENQPGAPAEMGEALGRCGVSIEGGGAWVVDGKGAAHFLFPDGNAARAISPGQANCDTPNSSTPNT
jgi:hypothetical protein